MENASLRMQVIVPHGYRRVELSVLERERKGEGGEAWQKGGIFRDPVWMSGENGLFMGNFGHPLVCRPGVLAVFFRLTYTGPIEIQIQF
jgi:hypothetical protein